MLNSDEQRCIVYWFKQQWVNNVLFRQKYLNLVPDWRTWSQEYQCRLETNVAADDDALAYYRHIDANATVVVETIRDDYDSQK